MSRQTLSSLTLLVPLDGSPLSEQALPFARMLAALAPARVHLLRVIAPSVVSSLVRYEAALLSAAGDTMGNRDEQTDRMREILQEEAAEYLVRKAALLEGHAQAVGFEVVFGQPAEQILVAANQLRASMIVMATHGKGGLLRWSMGSVTARVLQTTTAPVLVVRGAERPEAEVAAPRRIMVALDGSPAAERALPLAMQLARAASADVLLAQVIEPVDAPLASPDAGEATGRMRELAFGYLDRIATSITRDVGRHVTTTVPVGHVAEEIVEEAARKHIDLIVLGRYGLGEAHPSFLGGTAEKVSQASTTPLLVAG